MSPRTTRQAQTPNVDEAAPGTRFSRTGRPSPAEHAAVAQRLAELHYSAQQDAPSEFRDVPITQLHPLLRGLLFTDGTVSRQLEAITLSSVAVEPLEQQPGAAPAGFARHLDLAPGAECLRRRVIMRVAGERPIVWAESCFVAERLPPAFLASLDGNAQGIGGSLRELQLESRRELLWFGVGPAPAWSGPEGHGRDALTRAYRVLMAGEATLLICEAFAVERRSGILRLAVPDEPSGAT